MKITLTKISSLALACLLVAGTGHGQTALLGILKNDLAPVRPDTIVQVAADSQGLSLVLPEQVPACGTFWWVVPGGAALPTPCPPPDLSGAIYQIADGQFLVDETGGQVVVKQRRLGLQAQVTSSIVASAAVSQADSLVNLITQVQTATESQEIQTLSLAMGLDVPTPGDGSGDGTGTNSSDATGYTVPDYGTNLWIAQVAVASGNLTGIGTNTQADIQYDILSRTNLVQTDWQTESSIFGSETTNWTPFSVAQNNRTNLFIRLRSDASSDGSGLPDWWELEYFGTNGVDPYGNPAGDGYSNLQKFQSEMNPNVFYTPDAPQGITAAYNPVTGLVKIKWQPALGQVTGYTVNKHDSTASITTNINLPADDTSLTDNLSGDQPDDVWWGGPSDWTYYSVKANYGSSGSSAWSPQVMVEPYDFSISLISDGQGTPTLSVSAPPVGATALRLKRVDVNSVYIHQDFSHDVFYTIPLSGSTNGLYPIPAAWLAPVTSPYGSSAYKWWVQTVDANTNATGSFTELGYVQGYQFPSDSLVPPVFSGQIQLKQNLIFQLRAATVNGPLAIQKYDTNNYNPVYPTLTNTAAYGCSSFYGFQTFDQGNGVTDYQPSVDSLNLFADNYLYRNLVYNSADVDSSGALTTGVDYSQEWWGCPTAIQLPGEYNFQTPATNQTPIPAMLPSNNTQWFHVTPFGARGWFDNMGLTASYDSSTCLTTYTLPSDTRNWFGLPIISLKAFYTDPTTYNQDTAVITSGNSLITYDQPPTVYFETAQPQFHTVEYDFWQAQYYPSMDNYGNLLPNNVPLPGMSYFSTTNASQKMFMAVGSQLKIAGYAKLAVQNGYTGVFGYLGQYFDQAYKVDDNGIVTSTNTGVLSPYGQFFATEPGPVALVTMPDIDTGERGTCMVYSVGMVIDRTQGTNMDGRFNGPNATSSANPAVIWANNNYDRGHTVDGSDFEQDDLGPFDVAKLPSNQQMFDAFYAIDGQPAIPCTRDLEDYFRLWTPGLAALINVLPTNYTVQLKLSGDGQIRIYQAIEPDGGTNYLFDETTASNQVISSASLHVGLLSSTMPIILNCSSNFNEHFIFCGAHTGSAKVDLQVLDGNQNVMADTAACLQINDIKNMYERWTVGDNPKVAPMTVATNAANDLPSPRAFNYTAPTDTNTPYILFVHGWNMEPWEKDRYAETAYKRLCWQGYKGRFGEFRWPTDNGITGTASAIIHHKNFDDSESNAWASATGLLNKLNDLNTQYPSHVYLMAHSMGNVVAGEALRIASGQPVNTYVAMQGAISAHCYDPNTQTRQSYEAPDRYANYWANNSPCYFNNSAGAGAYINFYNANDYALGKWNIDQNMKPDIGYQYARLSDLFLRGTFSSTTLYFPANTYEIFAYCDPAWSYALGAQVDVGGRFTTAKQVDLQTVWPPDNSTTDPTKKYSSHKWHSAEFRSDFPNRSVYWQTVLGQSGFNLK